MLLVEDGRRSGEGMRIRPCEDEGGMLHIWWHHMCWWWHDPRRHISCHRGAGSGRPHNMVGSVTRRQAESRARRGEGAWVKDWLRARRGEGAWVKDWLVWVVMCQPKARAHQGRKSVKTAIEPGTPAMRELIIAHLMDLLVRLLFGDKLLPLRPRHLGGPAGTLTRQLS